MLSGTGHFRRGHSCAMAAANSLFPRFSRRQSTLGMCGNRNSPSLCPLHKGGGISSSEMWSENPLPSAFISASFIVHIRKKSCRLRFASTPANRDFSSAVSASSISMSRSRRVSRCSTSTPSRPRAASAISPWRPLWLTLKLIDAGLPPAWAAGFPCSPSSNASPPLAQASRPQRIARRAARHKANSRRGGSTRNFLQRACSSGLSQWKAVRSTSGCGERSTWKTVASPAVQNGRHHRSPDEGGLSLFSGRSIGVATPDIIPQRQSLGSLKYSCCTGCKTLFFCQRGAHCDD